MDLASSPAKLSAAVALTEELGAAFCRFLGDDDQIIQTIACLQPRLVAIDAPLGLPSGQHCLDKACSCPNLAKGRQAELALRRHRGLGIGCFCTNKNTIIPRLVCRGMKLAGELKQRGHKVIEVYPYATKVCLWGKPPYKKTTPQGLCWLREKLSSAGVSGLSQGEFDHHLADATLAAYTAYRHSLGQTEVLGGGEEEGIVIPKVS